MASLAEKAAGGKKKKGKGKKKAAGKKKPANKKKSTSKKKSTAKKSAAKKSTGKKKSESKKKSASKKEGKIIPGPGSDKSEDKPKKGTLTNFEDFKLPALKIGDKKGLSFSMTQLAKELSKTQDESAKTDYHKGVVVCHMLKNGKFNELGHSSAQNYFSSTQGIHTKVVFRYQRIFWFLRNVIGLTSDAKLRKAYENCIPSRVEQLAVWVVAGGITTEQAMEEMAYVVRDSGLANEEWLLNMKAKYGKAIAAAKAESGGDDGLIKVKGFKVEEQDHDMLIQAQRIVAKQTEKPDTSFGDTVVKACEYFVSHYGEGIVDVAQNIHAMEKAHGLVLLPVPVPGVKAPKDVGAIKVYEKDGTLVFMDSKRAAAKYFGVPTNDVNEVAIDPRPYLHKRGYAEKPKDVKSSPKTVDELTDEEAVERVAKLLKELGLSRDEWTSQAVGKSIRQQLQELAEMKEKKDAGEPYLIKGKDPEDDFDEEEEKPKAKKGKGKGKGKKSKGKKKPEPEPEPEPEPDDDEDDDEEDDDAIWEDEETGKLYLDEAMTIECDEAGRPIGDDEDEDFDDE